MANRLRFKANNWLDTKAHKVFYGIDVKMNGTWHHASADNQPLFFDTAEERDSKIVELRKEA
ncbi:MAG: hypothetical protein ACOYL3_16225 [Desulfuromonadaceae bacterium]